MMSFYLSNGHSQQEVAHMSRIQFVDQKLEKLSLFPLHVARLH